MKPPLLCKSTSRQEEVVALSHPRINERILAHRAVDNHGESRARVLESGGRVDVGVTTKRGISVGTGDSGREAHHARSDPEMDSGGFKLSVGLPQTPDAVDSLTHFPSQGKMTYGRQRWINSSYH